MKMNKTESLSRMDYFSALPDRHMFIVRDIYSDDTIRGRLSYLRVDSENIAWPYMRVPFERHGLLASPVYDLVCDRPDEVHVLFKADRIAEVFPIRRLKPDCTGEDKQVGRLIDAIVAHTSELACQDFGIAGSRLFHSALKDSDVDLVFYADEKVEALHRGIRQLERNGTILRLPLQKDDRLRARLATTPYSGSQITQIQKMQWFRKYSFQGEFLFNLSFASDKQVKSWPFASRDEMVDVMGGVIEARNSFVSPYRYLVGDIKSGRTRRVLTYIWAFRQCVAVGDRVRVRGKLAYDADGEFIYVNEPTDLMMPLVD